METQLDAFDLPNYRRTDPATSKAAGEAVTRTTRTSMARLLWTKIQSHPDRTVTELADILRAEKAVPWWRAVQVASKRLSDLEHRGEIRASGVRSCTLTGQEARTWRAT